MQVEDMVALAAALREADAAVEEADLLLKAAKEHARLLREETIPSAMQELGLESLTLEGGAKLTIKQDVYAQLTEENKPAAFEWLEVNGFGGLVKCEVVVGFGRGDLEEAQELYQELSERRLTTALTQSVHIQTLKAFLREQLASATNIPLDLFNARPVWLAKITSK